jgi:hypothetical protein
MAMKLTPIIGILVKRAHYLLASSLVIAIAMGGCAARRTAQGLADQGEDASTGPGLGSSSSGPGFGSSSGSSGGGEAGQPEAFDVEPKALQTITVPLGKTVAAMPYQATLNGSPISVGWTLDRGNVGTIGAGPSPSATFTANGTGGGLVNVIAGYQGATVKRQVMILLDGGTQNGPNLGGAGEQAQVATMPSQLTAGGGVGGVGGVGLGTSVTDMPTMMALQNPTNSGQAQNLTVIYPYDKTVFPRGLLAPLIQWSWTVGSADAIQLTLKTTSGSFSWTGKFGRPTILASLTAPAYCPGTTGPCPFANHPIPQDVWAAATNTAGGLTPNGMPDQLTMSLVVARGGIGYGPVTETWTIAPARLEGTVYYQSYGTRLVLNSNFLGANGAQVGAAVLAINEGALAPTVVAGTPSPCPTPTCTGAGCRVCHVVSGAGSTLITQQGDYSTTSWYNLKNGNAQTVLFDRSLFAWAGLSNDGTLALTNSATLGAGTGARSMQLYAFPASSTSSAPPLASNLPANVQGGTPAFSPDTRHVAFEFMSGTIQGVTGSSQLVAMDFDASTKNFTNLKVLATMQNAHHVGFPSFFPTNDAVAFHVQLVGNGGDEFGTRNGAEAQIWWSDLATGTASSLDALNGLDANGTTSYLPGPHHSGRTGTVDDTTLNYEPTVNPISSGGYIWAVFTSRRLYGNVATTDPWQSDPRSYDDSQLANATTKKLWVAAIDLNATPGKDPSHPAFYLPAQELVAGNSRGFWVLNPCKADGMSCMSGDECCNGYCEPSGPGGSLVCANTAPNNSCSMVQEKCTTAADCCNSTNRCINGFCAQLAVN